MTAGALIDEPIPQIEWSSERNGPGRKMLERAMNATTSWGDWRGWGSFSTFDYFLDWTLFGLGDPTQPEHPRATGNVDKGASERLYQLFDLAPLLVYPYDYFGDILAENSFGKAQGFFPTPMDLCNAMVRMQFEGEDMRAKSVCDPALGTGRMLLAASNYSYRLFGNDINNTVLKACRVNGWLYAPWLVKALPFLEHETNENTLALPEQLKPQLELAIV